MSQQCSLMIYTWNRAADQTSPNPFHGLSHKFVQLTDLFAHSRVSIVTRKAYSRAWLCVLQCPVSEATTKHILLQLGPGRFGLCSKLAQLLRTLSGYAPFPAPRAPCRLSLGYLPLRWVELLIIIATVLHSGNFRWCEGTPLAERPLHPHAKVQSVRVCRDQPDASMFLIPSRCSEYPNFYSQLYSLCRPAVVHVKYRSRFYRLLDLFLSSRFVLLCQCCPNFLTFRPVIYRLIWQQHSLSDLPASPWLLLHRPSFLCGPLYVTSLYATQHVGLCFTAGQHPLWYPWLQSQVR
jgi:hypothetical protein